MGTLVDSKPTSRTWNRMNNYELEGHWQETYHANGHESSHSGPTRVLWRRTSDSIPEAREQATQVLHRFLHGLEDAGVAGHVSGLEVYRRNDDGEIPCLILLKSDFQLNGKGRWLIESIHAVERDLWLRFRPLPWRFATTFDDLEGLPPLADDFFGTNPELDAVATR